MDYVFVPVWQIKGLWYFVTSSLVVASFLFCYLFHLVCVCVSMCECLDCVRVCVCVFQCRPLFVNLGLEFVIADLCRVTCLFVLVIFALHQVEDVYLVPLVGLGLLKLVFLMAAHSKHSAAKERNEEKLFLLKFMEPFVLLFQQCNLTRPIVFFCCLFACRLMTACIFYLQLQRILHSV